MDTYSDFFCYSTINDLFNVDHFGHYGWVFTKNYTNWIWYIIRDNDGTFLNYLYNNSSLINSFFENSPISFFYEKTPHTFLDQLSSDMVSLGFIKNDYEHLLRVFPDDYDAIMNAVVCSIAGEENLIEQVSAPFVKLYYPEPFIASPSFVHEEVWFIHILHYQHWLWFFFISLIMFYFVTFLMSVQYCSARNQPKRETRGVSRSKCADLITACVPVSWAMAIIISETVDATDYYDGFGTGQIVIGIRAYQWGWEYFYPKTLDLNYNVKPSYSTMIGNSLKYSNSSSENLNANSFWKSYQKKNMQNISSSPAHLLLSPSDNSRLINGSSFNNIGLSSIKDSSAFKKIQYFSKTSNQQCNSTVSRLSNRYNKINNMYLNTSKFNDSYSYGTFRQHSYTSLNSNLSSFESLLDNKGVTKFVNFTLNSNMKMIKKPFNSLFSRVTNQTNMSAYNLISNSSLLSAKNISNIFSNNSIFNLMSFYPTTTSIFSNMTDSKTHSNSVKYGFLNKNLQKSFKSSKNYLKNINMFSSSFYPSDILTLNSSFKTVSSIINNESSFKFKDLKSTNLQFLSSERNIRIPDQLKLNKNNFNLTTRNNNFESVMEPIVKNHLSPKLVNLYSSSSSNWLNTEVIKPLLSTNLTFNTSHTPLYTNKSHMQTKEFDRYFVSNDELTPVLFNSKEETAPNYLFSNYWLTYWSNTKQSHRISNMLNNSNLNNMFYIPRVTEFAEYDFKNWQSLEMLEDALWESSISTPSSEEYLSLKNEFKDNSTFNKQELIFNKGSRNKKFRSDVSSKSLKKSNYNTFVNSVSLFNDDCLSLVSNLTRKNFKPFYNETLIDSLDDSYENLKQSSSLFYNSQKYLMLKNVNFMSPISYTQILNAFRGNYEEFYWNNDFYMYNDANTSYLNPVNTSRNVNPLKLRLTARNSVVTYNAIQKVFKSRFDEGRSNARLLDLSNSFVSHPFLTQPKSSYESMLGKNTESFFSLNSYSSFSNTNFNNLYTITNSLNIPFFDIPFLVSLKSDASRYLWFDWQAKWSSIEIQPSSAARYSLTGVPYFNKSFEYNTQKNDTLNDSENYLNRLAKSRKNYLPSWSQTPYFYSRSHNWYRLNELNLNAYESVNGLKNLLTKCNNYWLSNLIFNSNTNLSTPSFSGVNTPIRSSWRPYSSIQSYYYTSSILVDILSKREFLYRNYFRNKHFVTTIPSFLVASPKNQLLNEVKNGFLLVDPINFSSEVSRELLYTNTAFLKFDLLKNFLNIMNRGISNSSVNLSSINNYFFFYLFGGLNNSTELGKSNNMYKNQYRPIKRGVTNMVKLQATGAIAMPIEIRLHIIASSRDVIHSWAIPSAGIKIDCVPGYSSHRVTIFLVSGIFWGQCMEICGRFHHWMPIIVYFMKKDLFFLWCTHFMHYSSISDVFNTDDKQFMDKVRLTSFDKTSWVNLINQIV